MSAFTRKPRPIAHPGWLPDAIRHMASVCRIEQDGRMPESLRFFMIENASSRVMRCCFVGRWSMLWFLLIETLRSERERLYGSLYRFWRYKVRGKSPDADYHRMMTQLCPRCHERHEIPCVGTEDYGLYRCEGCGSQMDFEELAMAQPEDEED